MYSDKSYLLYITNKMKCFSAKSRCVAWVANRDSQFCLLTLIFSLKIMNIVQFLLLTIIVRSYKFQYIVTIVIYHDKFYQCAWITMCSSVMSPFSCDSIKSQIRYLQCLNLHEVFTQHLGFRW